MVEHSYAEFWGHDNEFDHEDWIIENELNTGNADDIRNESKPEPKPTPELDPHEEWLNEGPFWGSKKSNKYHEPSCYWAKQIKNENRIIFQTRRDAINRNYVACKVCDP
jgi:hypothetical protein